MQDGRYGLRVRLRMGYHSTYLNKSYVTPLYQIMLPGELIFGVNLEIRGQSIGQMSSSRSFSVKECSTKGHVHMLMTLKTSYPQQKHHNMNP